MSIKVMIIDGEADFRSLLMHHVTTHWPDANLLAYDPVEAGRLPREFSGAGNDIILLGDDAGEDDAAEMLAQFAAIDGFPPIVYFGRRGERETMKETGASAFFERDAIRHDALIVRMGDELRARGGLRNTNSLFVGDVGAGISPIIRGYRLIRKLAVSNHSAVYLCVRESDAERAVLKVLKQVPDTSDSVGEFDRFLQEYELIADLDHPNIVKIYDLGVADDHAHIAMEFLSGGDLKRRIGQGINEQDALRYLREIAGAIGEIHSVGILHRDLKPGNIMLRKDDSIGLIDFGLAKRMRLRMELTGSGEIFGTPYYMSPEQGHGDDIDARSDIYSLGVIFYEMLTGEKPFQADSAMGIIYKHSEAPIPKLPSRLKRHQVLVDRLLAKKPGDRPANIEEVLKLL
jgi:serine/threonine protein kinase